MFDDGIKDLLGEFMSACIEKHRNADPELLERVIKEELMCAIMAAVVDKETSIKAITDATMRRIDQRLAQ